MRAGIVEDEDPAPALGEARARVEEHIPDPEERGLVEPRLAPPARPRRADRTGPASDLFAAWRLFFERLAERLPDGARLRGHALGRRGAARLRRVPARLVAQPPDLRAHARATRAARAAADLGRRRSGTSRRSSWSRSPSRRWRSCSTGSCRGSRGACATRILERAEGIPLYAVETVRMLLDRGAARAGRRRLPARRARSRRSRCPRRCTR